MCKRNKLILFFILIFGLWLRLFLLGKESFAVDELLTYLNSSSFNTCPTLISKIKYLFTFGHFAPYFLIMHYWMKLFGAGEFALRFPSVVFGVMSIYAMFLLGRKFFNEKVAILASYLFAVSTINIFHSQFARPYSLGVFFVLMSFLFLLESLEKNTRLFWLLYVSFSLLALFINTSSLPMLFSQIIFIMLCWMEYKKCISLKKIIFIYIIITVIYLPFLLILVVPNLRDLDSALWFSRVSFGTFLHIFNLFGGKIWQEIMYANPTSNPYLYIPANIFGIVLLLLGIIGIFNYSKSNIKEQFQGTLLLSLWLGVPILLPYIFSYLVTPVFGPARYLLHISCAYYLLIAKGIMSLSKNIRILVILFVAFLGLIFLHEYYQVEKRVNWEKVCTYVKENIQDYERTVIPMSNSIAISFVEYEMLLHYSAPSLLGIKLGEDSGEILREGVVDLKSMPMRAQWYAVEDLDCSGLWLIIWHSVFSEAPNYELYLNMIEKLEGKYTLKDKIEFADISLYHFSI